jgi:hypothetical protein
MLLPEPLLLLLLPSLVASVRFYPVRPRQEAEVSDWIPFSEASTATLYKNDISNTSYRCIHLPRLKHLSRAILLDMIV